MTALKHFPNGHFTDCTVQEARRDRRVIRVLYRLPLSSGFKMPEGQLSNRVNEDRTSAAWQDSMRRLEAEGLIEFTPCFHGIGRAVQLTRSGREWGEDMQHEDEQERREKEYSQRDEPLEAE
jgi:hypothetical protein